MIAMAISGILIGIATAYMGLRAKSKFRMKLIEEFESQSNAKAAERHLAIIIERRAKWAKSISVVRKPFNKDINLAIETVALLLAIMAMITSIVNFDKSFSSHVQGVATVIFLGIVMGYIPTDWFLGGRVDKDIEGVMQEMGAAIKTGDLKTYMIEAKKNWK